MWQKQYSQTSESRSWKALPLLFSTLLWSSPEPCCGKPVMCRQFNGGPAQQPASTQPHEWVTNFPPWETCRCLQPQTQSYCNYRYEPQNRQSVSPVNIQPYMMTMNCFNLPSFEEVWYAMVDGRNTCYQDYFSSGLFLLPFSKRHDACI